MRYRTSADIVCQILETAFNGCNEASLMFRVFLDYEKLKGYLEFMVDNDLLRQLQEKESYRTSEKGKEFLRHYKQLGKNTARSGPPPIQMPIFGKAFEAT